MPRRKKNGNRRRYRRRNPRVPRQLIPNKIARTFRYQTTVSLDPSAVAIDYNLFRMNGMFDPEVAVGGHQPMGFDEFVGILYDHFVVIGSKITCTFASNSSSTSGSYMVGITPQDNTNAPPGSISALIEQGRSKYRQVQPYTGPGGLVTLTHKMNPNKFLGRPSPLSDPELKGSASGDPSEGAYWGVWAGSMNGSTDPTAIVVNILLEYKAVLIEPKILSPS